MGKRVERAKLLRVIDANLNRSSEAARVVEEYARFVIDHSGLANSVKSLRHRLRESADVLGVTLTELLSARDTELDVGARLVGAHERERSDLAAVLRANFLRLEQSLRVLEEYSKLLGAPDAGFESLRYDVYTVEKQFDSPPERPATLADKPLMVLVGSSATARGTPAEVVRLTRAVLKGGCRLIELREKDMPDGEFLALARELRELTRRARAILIVNDRVDIARASGADGVHLGLDDLPASDARKILGPSKLIGLTAHSGTELRDAESRGADYIGVGTMFRSPTKPKLKVTGPARLIPATLACSVPCYAIGGITRENLDALRRLASPRGAQVPVTDARGTGPRDGRAGHRSPRYKGLRVAVGSAIASARNVARETRWFQDRL
jgi:thiamine-phosphate pyrophosphorylase